MISFLLLLSSTAAAQDSCSSLDHRPRMPPVRNQMGTEWCYAFTAADLLSFEAGQSISAIGVGIQTQRDFKAAFWKLPHQDVFTKSRVTLQALRKEVFEGTYNFDLGGDTELALVANMHLAPSLCIEEDLPQREYSLVVGDKPRGMRTRESLDAIRNLVMTKHPNDRRVLQPDEQLCNEFDDAAKFLFPSANLADFRRLALTIDQKTDPLGAIYDLACQRRVHISKGLSTVKVMKEGDGSNLIEALDKQLERSPAAISYHIDSLKNPDLKAAASNHASSIVARQRNPETGECEYLLRNSWGTECNPRSYHSTNRCENGNAWIPASNLKKMLFNITGIQ